jgi:hypothetical protein
MNKFKVGDIIRKKNDISAEQHKVIVCRPALPGDSIQDNPFDYELVPKEEISTKKRK